jgi:hypothetical protein
MSSNATTNETSNVTSLPSTPRPQTAKEVIAANVKLLIEQLEAGHSEALLDKRWTPEGVSLPENSLTPEVIARLILCSFVRHVGQSFQVTWQSGETRHRRKSQAF